MKSDSYLLWLKKQSPQLFVVVFFHWHVFLWFKSAATSLQLNAECPHGSKVHSISSAVTTTCYLPALKAPQSAAPLDFYYNIGIMQLEPGKLAV